MCSAVLHEHRALKSAGTDGAQQPLHSLIPVKLEGQICTATSTHVPRMLCNRLVTHMPLSCSLCLMNKKRKERGGFPGRVMEEARGCALTGSGAVTHCPSIPTTKCLLKALRDKHTSTHTWETELQISSWHPGCKVRKSGAPRVAATTALLQVGMLRPELWKGKKHLGRSLERAVCAYQGNP